MDSYLSEHYVVPPSYFDDLLKREPSSFLVGMKVFFNFYDLGVDKCEQILRHHETVVNRDDPYKSYLDIARCAILNERGKVDEAISVIKKARGSDPKNKWCLLEHYYLVSTHNLPETEEILNDLISQFPDWPWAKMERALTIHSHLHEEDAASIINSLPDTLRNEDTENFLGDVYLFSEREHYISIKYYQDSLKIKENPSAWYGLGNYEDYYNNDKVAAAKCYQRAIAIDETCAAAYSALAWMKFYEQDLSDVEGLFKKALEVEVSVDSYWDLILYYLKTDNFWFARQYANEIKNHWGDTHDSAARLLVVQLAEDNSDRDQLIADYIETHGPGSEEFLSTLLEDAGMEL